ncbi:PfaD family polyunsaturated fatty acid/polyketide biosynthesis protein [Desulfobotulus mexicanus]|nr:PfaD family polyunsaturated fatty acid/polyketide biosynthesis protein [Desulfobotulus mexicanus]
MTTDITDSSMGWWQPGPSDKAFPETDDPKAALLSLRSPLFLVLGEDGKPQLRTYGQAILGSVLSGENSLPLLAFVPPLPPENLGSRDFLRRHGLKYPYIAGAMANGITSEAMVMEAGRAGGMGFFGAGGCTLARIEKAIATLKKAAESSPFPFGFNFLHQPGSPEGEMALAQLYLNSGITSVCAAAFMRMTPAIVLYRVRGVTADEKGRPLPKNRIIAKVSRVEIAEKFLAPPPEKILKQLLSQGLLSKEEARLGALLPMANDITAEADSGGHTDNRPAMALLPAIKAARDAAMAAREYTHIPCVGLGGGIATPASAAAAFALGADYILVGSVHQACVESGTSDTVREMLARCGQADVTMTAAADMFEMGGRVQVLKRETMFALRAQKLYTLYREYPSMEALPEDAIRFLEDKIFQKSIAEEWESTRRFFMERDPSQLKRAEEDPRHHMALLFRSYLGQASLWAIQGNPDRKVDYQVWCGPAMGAFNAWTKNSFLEEVSERRIRTVAFNLLAGAATLTRFSMLKVQYPEIPAHLGNFSPLGLNTLEPMMS